MNSSGKSQKNINPLSKVVSDINATLASLQNLTSSGQDIGNGFVEPDYSGKVKRFLTDLDLVGETENTMVFQHPFFSGTIVLNKPEI